ncbi:MAG: CsgG/HfaB family protein [Thermodesulfovibrionales bacterium]|nr:CsgG/HfaB family protein [Thermodesulfovibrionales bacterium]
MMRMLSILALLLLASVACAPPAVKTTALMPARFHDAAKVREVAVLPFDGRGGAEFAAEIEGMLAGVNIGDKQYFTLIDRVRIDKLISEMKLSQSALVDPNTAAKVGKLVGAKGIYTGVITASDTSDSRYREERTRCAYNVTQYDKKGRAYQGCGRWETYTVSCTKRVATFDFTPKLIEVETGKVVYANNVSGTATSSACSDSQAPLASNFDLIERAKLFAKTIFKRDVAPYYVTFEIKLMDSTNGITSKEAEKKFEQGISYAKGNRLDRACELWGEARILSPNTPSILYNLGICSEVTGELEHALDLYKKADRAYGKPDDRITSALHRVSTTIQKEKKLKEQIGR